MMFPGYYPGMSPEDCFAAFAALQKAQQDPEKLAHILKHANKKWSPLQDATEKPPKCLEFPSEAELNPWAMGSFQPLSNPFTFSPFTFAPGPWPAGPRASRPSIGDGLDFTRARDDFERSTELWTPAGRARRERRRGLPWLKCSAPEAAN